MIKFTQKGDFKKTMGFLERSLEVVNLGLLDKYGREGVRALQNATPVDSGKTAQSWYYEIERKEGSASLYWCNDAMDADNDTPLAILIQYGHGTRGGTYVEGIDFVNPALKPVFDEMAERLWKEVTR